MSASRSWPSVSVFCIAADGATHEPITARLASSATGRASLELTRLSDEAEAAAAVAQQRLTTIDTMLVRDLVAALTSLAGLAAPDDDHPASFVGVANIEGTGWSQAFALDVLPGRATLRLAGTVGTANLAWDDQTTLADWLGSLDAALARLRPAPSSGTDRLLPFTVALDRVGAIDASRRSARVNAR